MNWEAREGSVAAHLAKRPAWRSVPLGSVIADAIPGFAAGQRDSSGVVQLRMNNVDTFGRMTWESITRVPKPSVRSGDPFLAQGDVLFNNTNSTELVGKSAQFLGFGEPVAFSNHFTRLRPRIGELDSGYLAMWLRLQWSAGVFARICNKWIGQSAVKTDKLFALEIPLPPLTEQKHVAAVVTEQMTAVDKARAAARAKLDALKAMPAANLREAFEGKETLQWRIADVGSVSEIVSGITLGRKLRNEPTRRLPYLRVANVKDGHLDLDEVYSIDASESEIEKLALRNGDLLLTEGGDPDKLGRGTVWSEEFPLCLHQNHIFRVRLDTARCIPKFVSAQIGSSYGKRYFLAHAKQTTGIATINQRVLKAFPLMLPSLEEQARIVESLERRRTRWAAAIAAAESELAAINALPAALLRRAFSGELSAKPAPYASRPESPLQLRAACAALYAHRWATQRKRTGKTKLAKAQALSQTHVGLSLPNPLRRYPHGPYDPEFDAVIAHAVEQGWLRACKVPGFSDPVYEAGPQIGEALAYLDSTATSLRPELDRLATLMLDWDRDRAERVATLFTAWNDLLIEHKAADEGAVVEEVLHRWHADKALKFTAQALRAELAWMRTKGLVPRGKGPRTEGGQGSLDFARGR